MMKSVNILLLCMLGAALLSTVLCNMSSGPDNCCFDFFRNRMDRKLFTSYYRTDPRCATSGIVLITKRARRICVDAKEKWVEKIVENLVKKTL